MCTFISSLLCNLGIEGSDKKSEIHHNKNDHLLFTSVLSIFTSSSFMRTVQISSTSTEEPGRVSSVMEIVSFYITKILSAFISCFIFLVIPSKL